MGLRNSLNFVLRHPLSQGRKLANLGRLLAWQIGSRLVPGPVIVDFVNGAKLVVRPGMTGATGNVYVGLHEFPEMAFALHFLRPGDLFVDVGANIGSYTVLAAAAAGADCIAFEPSAEAYKWLLLNIALNDIADHVEPRLEAVGGKRGVVAFTSGQDTLNGVVRPGQETSASTRSVPITTLDSALDGRCPIMLKVDVEGYETEVLNGATALLESTELRVLIMELAGSGLHYGFDEQVLRARIQEHGFEACIYQPFERRLTRRLRGSALPNTIFLRDYEAVKARLENAPCFTVQGLHV